MKFPFVKQEGYIVPLKYHNTSLVDCIKWWLGNKNKHCHSCCLTCRWWLRCKEDIEFEKHRR